VAKSRPDTGILSWQRSISVFIPALNEEKNLEPTVARLIEALTVTVEDYERRAAARRDRAVLDLLVEQNRRATIGCARAKRSQFLSSYPMACKTSAEPNKVADD
jgi:hypothetical protein